jgi:PAS domain-containing protein
LGLGPDRVVGRSIFETCQDLPEIVENVRRALAGQTLNALLKVDGSTFETWYSPVRENGELSGVLGVAVDVTERRRAEEELRESERRFATLLSNAPAYLYRCLNEPGWPNEFVSEVTS